MGLHKDSDDDDVYECTELYDEFEHETDVHKREMRKLIEERLEELKLKKELEDFDSDYEDEFDWD